MANLKELDPVKGLVDYVLDVKPYHTKIVEVLIEYVYTENVDVRIFDKQELDFLFSYPRNPLVAFACDTGLDSYYYDDNPRISVTSPNPSVLFQDYPAINSLTDSFTVLGDIITDIQVNDSIILQSHIEDFTNIYGIHSVNAGAAGTASFVIKADPVPTELIVNYTFNVIGSDNAGTYTIMTLPTSDGTYTTIPVYQSISSAVAGGTLGITMTAGSHSGTFTVSDITFDEGTIDYQTDPSDVNTKMIGDHPHTVISVSEDLVAIPALTATQHYVVQMILNPVPIESALSYSRALKKYNPAGPTYEQNPDEGYNEFPIVGVTISTLVLGVPVSDSGKFVLEGDFGASNVFVGDTIQVKSSVGNNGTYTITSILYNIGDDETTFGVDELVDGNTVSGFAALDIPANVFIVDGDRRRQFTQGRQFDVFGGLQDRTYTILNSDFYQGKTRVRIAESIFDIGQGDIIVGTTGGFQILGDKSTVFVAGVTFTVLGSVQNDGVYTVDVGGATYNSSTGLTTIPVVEAVESTPGGEVHLSLHGSFKRTVYGFDQNSPVCDVIPDTLLQVYLSEHLHFSGLGFDVSDDLIVYNMENNNPNGYEFPVTTLMTTTSPPVPSQGTAPLAPSLYDLWYDTNVSVFKQYDGNRWVGIKRAWWFDTDDNLLYYRTITTSPTSSIDTGWVLDSVRYADDPGSLLALPAVPAMTQIDIQSYGVTYESPGVPTVSFTLDTPVPNQDPSLLKVQVNNMPAGFTLTTATTFDITSPFLLPNDIVLAEVFNRTVTEQNAHVEELNLEPHKVLHSWVTVDLTNNAYVVSGGNFLDRFVPVNSFTGYNNVPTSVGQWNVSYITIKDVDSVAGTITIGADYTWLFTNGRTFRVNPSVTNYNDFIVQSSSYNGGADETTIVTTQPPFESSNVELDASIAQNFYNRPLSIISITAATDTITVSGKVTESFPDGMDILVGNSTSGNNQSWVVSSTSYNTGSDSTDIIVVGDMPDDDLTTNATVQTPIFQQYTKDFGFIVSAVYEPSSTGTGVYDTGQPKTIVAVTAVDNTVESIGYTWTGPLRMDIAYAPTTSVVTSITDPLLMNNEMTGGAMKLQILDTDATANTFTLHYDDPVTGLAVDLGDYFTPGKIFNVMGSYSNNDPLSEETNNAIYVVSSVFWDEGGTGDTILTIETNFDNVPPINSFNVVAISNNGAGMSTITLTGDHVNLFNGYQVKVFRLDQALIDVDPYLNMITVVDVQLDTGNTVLTIDAELLNETYTGALGIIEATYRANIYFDETNVTLPYLHGSVSLPGSSSSILTATTITDELSFGWGDVIRWNIIDTNQSNSSIDLYGDYTGSILEDDPVSIVGSQGNDGDYEVSSVTYSAGPDTSTIVLKNPVLPVDPSTSNIDISILSVDVSGSPDYFVIDGEGGDHVDFLRPTTTFDVVNSASNDGTYTVNSTVYDSGTDTLRVNVDEVIPSTDSSGDVRYQKKLAGKLEIAGLDLMSWYQYNIVEMLYASSDVIVVGNAVPDVQSGQDFRILGTEFNNTVVTASSAPVYDSINDISTIPVFETLNPSQKSIVELPSTSSLKVVGTAANYLRGGDTVTIINSTGNDGAYTVLTATYEYDAHSVITFTSTLPDATPDGDIQYNERGGWIESTRYQGIKLEFIDAIDISTGENADAAVLLTSGSITNAWDYNYFDIGGFDEDLGTIVHLYSNTL